MLITRALYGLKSSGAAFRNLLVDKIWDLGHRPSRADNDVWLRPEIKPNGQQYYEYVMTYVDDVIDVGHDPMKIMKGINQKPFTFKNGKIEEPDMYLGASLSKIVTGDGRECWAMSSDKYCASAVMNVEESLKKRGMRLPSKCYTPLSSGYRPELDATAELKAEGL